MRFDFDPTGATLALCDGPELLVHDGPTEGPRWRFSFSSDVMAVACAGARVMAADEQGRLVWFDARTGDIQVELELEAPPLALASRRDGVVAVALPDEVIVRSASGEGVRLPIPDASLVSWSPGGTLAVAVGPQVVLIDRDGRERRREGMSHVVTALCRVRAGLWAVAGGTRVMQLPDEGPVSHLTNAPDGLPVVHLASNQTGDRLALQLGDRLVVVLAWPSRDTAGQVQYVDRSVSGLAFGPGRWLGIGLEGGDANKVDLATGDTHRTDPHEGRERRTWMVSVAVEPEGIPVTPPSAPTPAPAPEVHRDPSEFIDELELDVTEPTDVKRPDPLPRDPSTESRRRSAPRAGPAPWMVWSLAAALALAVGLAVVVVLLALRVP